MKLEIRIVNDEGRALRPSLVAWKLWKQVAAKVDSYLAEPPKP